MATRVLVTGGMGFIGSHLVEALLKEGYEVFVLDRHVPSRFDEKPIVINADIIDKKRLDSVADELGSIDYVFHLAAQVSVAFGEKNPDENRKINVEGTGNVLELAKTSNAQGFIFFSSAAVYGNAMSLPIKESDSAQPINQYGLSKLEAEKLCMEYSDFFNVTIIRPFNVYGTRQKPGNDVVSVFIDKINKGETLTVFGEGEQTRDFIFVDDIVSVSLSAMKNSDAYSGIFNVGTGKETKIKDLAEMLMKIIGKKVSIDYEKERPGEIKRSVADISKLHELGFNPISLEDGLRKTVAGR